MRLMCRREEKHTTASSAHSGAEDTKEGHRMQEHRGGVLRRIAHFFFFFAERGRKRLSLQSVKGRMRARACVCIRVFVQQRHADSAEGAQCWKVLMLRAACSPKGHRNSRESAAGKRRKRSELFAANSIRL